MGIEFWTSVYIVFSERGQPKRITTILDPKYAEKERIGAQKYCGPQEHRNLLATRIGHTRNLEG